MKIESFEFLFENVEGFSIPAKEVSLPVDILDIIYDAYVKDKNEIKMQSFKLFINKDADTSYEAYKEIYPSKFDRFRLHNDICEILVHTTKPNLPIIKLVIDWRGPYDEYNLGQSSNLTNDGHLIIDFK